MMSIRDDPSYFLHQSSDEDDSSSWESVQNHSPPPPQPPPQRKHFCVICNKQFSSGKAYGGHVRVHSIEYTNKRKTKKMKKKKKKKKLKKRKIETLMDVTSRADVESKIRCCLCGKVFQTMHSLFGHMRRHPDRNWKGIRPPPSPPQDKFKLGFLDDVNDDDDVMRDATEEVLEAAYTLMILNNDMNKDGKEKRKRECEMDSNKGLIVDDMKLRDHYFDLNQPYQEDHSYSY